MHAPVCIVRQPDLVTAEYFIKQIYELRPRPREQICNNGKEQRNSLVGKSELCKEVPREKCVDVPSEVCKDVARDECRDRSVEVCRDVPREECKDVTVEPCEDVPRENCSLEVPFCGGWSTTSCA